MENYYVYLYLNEKGKPYYVGKGRGRRYKSKHLIPVPPVDRIVFAVENTTEDYAHYTEMCLIDHYGRLNDGTGVLVNLTDGGEGVSNPSQETRFKMGSAFRGKPRSEETKLKISKTVSGTNHYFYGKRHSKETLDKISLAQVGVNNHFYGKRHSKETLVKMSLAKQGKVEGSNNPMFGKMWITNGTNSYRIDKTDSIPVGYRRGRVINYSRQIHYELN